MTHKPAVGIGGFGRNNTSELIDRSPYIASAAPSSSPTSKAPAPPKAAASDRAASDVGVLVNRSDLERSFAAMTLGELLKRGQARLPIPPLPGRRSRARRHA